ncbi:MAG: Crp/Fnr family transcriptional regulator [Pseudomonas sp.]|nr:MAG: Crp/Fnr family transcriptional regulator [Pseudomonas sp.]
MASVDNHLIHLISRTERRALLTLCEQVPLVLSQVLWTPSEVTEHVYFPVEGFISLVATGKGNPNLEVGMRGREGMLGDHVVLGTMPTPVRAVVHGQGWAWRLTTQMFQKQLATSPSTKRVLDRYVSLLMNQFITASMCLHYHAVAPRLARWLLMSQDRACSDRLSMTHELISRMIGARRVSVTLAAGLLQQEGLIEYSHGHLRVLDRAGLEAAACDCYEIDRQSYADTMG